MVNISGYTAAFPVLVNVVEAVCAPLGLPSHSSTDLCFEDVANNDCIGSFANKPFRKKLSGLFSRKKNEDKDNETPERGAPQSSGQRSGFRKLFRLPSMQSREVSTSNSAPSTSTQRLNDVELADDAGQFRADRFGSVRSIVGRLLRRNSSTASHSSQKTTPTLPKEQEPNTMPKAQPSSSSTALAAPATVSASSSTASAVQQAPEPLLPPIDPSTGAIQRTQRPRLSLPRDIPRNTPTTARRFRNHDPRDPSSPSVVMTFELPPANGQNSPRSLVYRPSTRDDPRGDMPRDFYERRYINHNPQESVWVLSQDGSNYVKLKLQDIYETIQ